MHFLLILAATATATAATIDLSPILNLLLQFAGLVLTAVVAWLGSRVATYFHVSTQSQLFANVLGAVDRGIGFAQQTLGAKIASGDKIAVSNALQAQAVNYVVSKLPDTLSKLGITPAHVSDLVTAKLGSVPAAPPPSAPAG
jgi:hypothetical protein